MTRSLLTLVFAFISVLAMSSDNEGYLGISVRSHDIGNGNGLRIVNVYDEGAGRLAGLMENDIITGFNGIPVNNSMEFNKFIAAYQWGDDVNISYMRDGLINELNVTLGYAANKKTYEILKSEQLSGEVIWYFDDNTTIIIKDDIPLSITKKFKSGEKETLELEQIKDYSDQLPQNFLDLQDKLDVIAYTLDEQKQLNKDADQILFTKEVIHSSAAAKQNGIEKMDVSQFDVFPNPSNGHFIARIAAEGSGTLSYDIYDMRGSSIESGSVTDFNNYIELQFDISSKFKGVYMLYFRLGDKKLSKRVVFN